MRRAAAALILVAALTGCDNGRIVISPITTTPPTAPVPTLTVRPTTPTTAPPTTTRPPRTTTPAATRTRAAPLPQSESPGGVAAYRNCADARAAGAAPVFRGQGGYGRHLDRDGDGVGCENGVPLALPTTPRPPGTTRPPVTTTTEAPDPTTSEPPDPEPDDSGEAEPEAGPVS